MNSKAIVLLVDDEEDLCRLMAMTLSRMGIQSYIAHTVKQAKACLATQHFDACLTDLNLPDGNGIQLVQYISEYYTSLPVAVLTAYGNMEIAISALKAGAFDFVNKPINQRHLEQLLEKALHHPLTFSDANQQELLLEHQMLMGQSHAMQELRVTLKKIARSQAPVFITGESGTGKEVVANLIHRLSNRNDGPFIAINCGAIPNDLMESELFGHKKGSFTGATQDKQGLILSAQGGSLFLDEIAELPLNMQVKLLRTVQEKKIRPIGSDQEIEVDFRIISASHQDLESLVHQGRFRQDLFFRIHVMDIILPPLRNREHDILLLAHYFSHKISQEWGIQPKIFNLEAETFLLAQHYPGNVRELRNIIERAVTLCDGECIKIEHLQTTPLNQRHHIANNIQKSDTNQSTQSLCTNITTQYVPTEGLELYLEKIEKEILLHTLNSTHWNRTLAAKKLKMSFRSLRYRLKKFELDHDEQHY